MLLHSIKVTQKYESNGREYNIKPKSYPAIQSYIYRKDSVVWVDYDEPYIIFAVEIGDGNVKKVRREARELLKNEEISQFVSSKTENQ